MQTATGNEIWTKTRLSSVIWYPHLPPPSSFFSIVFYNEPGLRPKDIFLNLSQLFLVFKGWSFCALRKDKKPSCFNQDNKGFFVLKQDAVDPALDCQAVCTWKLSNLPLLWFVYERIRLNLINPRVLKIERGLHVKMLDSAPFTVQPWKNATCLRGHFAQKDLRNQLLFRKFAIKLCIIQYYRKIHYLTREFHVKLHAKTDIARIAKRWVRYRFSSAI